MKEFLNDLKSNNETAAGGGSDGGGDLIKRLFGAAVSLSERQDTDNSVFMLWTIPTTILRCGGLLQRRMVVGMVGVPCWWRCGGGRG